MLPNMDLSDYDRESISKLEDYGFQILDDLIPLYRMAYDLNKYRRLSKEARARLKWFDYHSKHPNISRTCRYFGISRKTFHKWANLYDPDNLWSLEDRKRTPKNFRRPEITQMEEQRILALRKQYICWGKEKLSVIYFNLYGEKLSAWKIYRVIKKYQLYHNPVRTAKIARKRAKSQKRKRITELKKKKRSGFLICLDAVELRYHNLKRFIFTGIDYYSKIAFARMYKNANSRNAADFLNRLMYLVDGEVENIQADNGSPFEKYFERARRALKLSRYYSRPHTPKDNPFNERFNGTLQYEFVKLGNFNPDCPAFNRNLTEWLIEYNFVRPHESLNYQTPIKFHNSSKVLPMYPTGTNWAL